MSTYTEGCKGQEPFWPKMASGAKEEQRDCKTCSMFPLDQAKVLNGEIQEEDWQDPYLNTSQKVYYLQIT